MTKTIHFKVPTELYYKLVALKAQTKLDTWEELMNHITQPNQPTQTTHTTTITNTPTPEDKQQKCMKCGHERGAHGKDDLCYGITKNGGACYCKKFTEGAPP